MLSTVAYVCLAGPVFASGIAYTKIAAMPCSALLRAEITDGDFNLMNPVEDYVSEKSDICCGVSIRDYILTQCRLNERYTIGEAVERLLEKNHSHQLPNIPIGGTMKPEDLKDRVAFEKWLQ
jgi:hypothetical protein